MPVTSVCKINLKKGLHARTSAELMDICNQYDANITLVSDHGVAKGDSILQLLSLCLTYGSQVEIEASGSQAQQAIQAITDYLQSDCNH